ncbi:hypothetical protein CPC08DRAFT_132550 [Agrocybe pediades]|nr:hypothetical protein CPC08DRAFT_132550 [Agrocybe pediades]
MSDTEAPHKRAHGAKVTKQQKNHIRKVGKLIYKAQRMSFKTIGSDIDRKLRATPAQYQMDNIYGILARESTLISVINKVASGVRSVFRDALVNSVSGSKSTTLEAFTADMNTKYRAGNLTHADKEGYLMHNALLRRFTRQYLLKKSKERSIGNEDKEESSSGSESESADNDSASPPRRSPAKKRKRSKEPEEDKSAKDEREMFLEPSRRLVQGAHCDSRKGPDE